MAGDLGLWWFDIINFCSIALRNKMILPSIYSRLLSLHCTFSLHGKRLRQTGWKSKTKNRSEAKNIKMHITEVSSSVLFWWRHCHLPPFCETSHSTIKDRTVQNHASFLVTHFLELTSSFPFIPLILLNSPAVLRGSLSESGIFLSFIVYILLSDTMFSLCRLLHIFLNF